MQDVCLTCSGSGRSSPNRLGQSEYSVQRTHANRGGGASLQVRSPARQSETLIPAVDWGNESPVCLPVSFSGVDDAESECGLDSGVKFDWVITNEADAPSLEEQVRPILRQALEAADQH